MIDSRGAEVLAGFAIDLLTTYGQRGVAKLDDADLRQRLTGMDDPAVWVNAQPLFDDQLDDAVRLLRRILAVAVIDISWRPGAIEAVRTQ